MLMDDYEVSSVQYDDIFTHYALLLDCDLITFQEAIKDIRWKKLIGGKIRSIEKNNTWKLIELSKR